VLPDVWGNPSTALTKKLPYMRGQFQLMATEKGKRKTLTFEIKKVTSMQEFG